MKFAATCIEVCEHGEGWRNQFRIDTGNTIVIHTKTVEFRPGFVYELEFNQPAT